MGKKLHLAETKEQSFTKNALIKSTRFEQHKLLLKALLEDEKEYTIEQVEKLINSFLKKGVK